MPAPPTITKIQVTACDNELYIIAVPIAGIGSSEILHMTSGFNDPVSYTVKPQSILPKGVYTLILVGINWGGPSAFTVALTGGPTFNAPTNLPVGASFTQAVQITV